MKKVILLVCSLFALASCSVKVPYLKQTYFTDYRAFTQNGFFITESDAVSFDYDAVGHMEVLLRSGHEMVESGKVDKNGAVVPKVGLLEKKSGGYKIATLQDAINEFREKAIQEGADGALSLQIKSIVLEGSNAITDPDVIVGYRISGMLIKIR